MVGSNQNLKQTYLAGTNTKRLSETMHAILLSSKFDKLPVIPRRRRRLLLLALVVRHLHKLSEHPSQLFSNPSCDRISFFCHLELDMTWGQRPISYVFVQLLNWHQYYEQCHRPAHSAAAWPLGCPGCFGRERRYGACRMGRFLRLGGMVTKDGDGKKQGKYLYLIIPNEGSQFNWSPILPLND